MKAARHQPNHMSFFLVFVFSCLFTLAQNENNMVQDSIIHLDDSNKITWDMSFTIKTMNVFRGVVPSRTPVYATQAGVKLGDFIIGAYGGSSFNNGYVETDLILGYYQPKFNIRADWYYNFTQGITNRPTPDGFFDFKPSSTRGMLDVMLNVKLTKHLEFGSSTLVYGRDRGVLQEDAENNIPLRRGEQRYSQFFSLQYAWEFPNAKVYFHAGYSFSWQDPSGASFYNKKPGFNDIGVSFYKNIISSETITIPFKAALVFNTLSNDVYLTGTLMLLQLSKL